MTDVHGGSRGDEFNEEEFARELAEEVLPDLLGRGDPDAGARRLGGYGVVASPEEESAALLEASGQFRPPRERLRRAGDTFRILMGMTAFRAASPDLLEEYGAHSFPRYAQAATWVCDNFGELIWWDCD